MQYSHLQLSDYNWQDDNIVIICKDEDSQLANLPEALHSELKLFLEETKFSSDETKVAVYNLPREGKVQRIFLVKLKAEPCARGRRAAMRSLEAQLREHNVREAAIVFASEFCAKASSNLLTQLSLASYRFDQHLGHGGPLPNADNELPEKPADKSLNKLNLVFAKLPESPADLIDQAFSLADSIRLTRLLVDQPANFMTPKMLAEAAVAAGEKYGFEVEVKKSKEIQELGMDAYWSVAKGSDCPPRFIIMRYLNHPECSEKIALVGKGVCYDSGGYAIKPASGMVTMHADMGGAGAVIGAITALARAKAKVNVVAIVAACENMISGNAMRNGDIIGSLAGKTIEVVNTDAEGRLTLADAVTYAQRFEKASKIIDIATLTGACVVALGNEIAGVISNDEEIFSALEHGSKLSGDKIWRMPCDEDYALLNKSQRADICNAGSRWGGMITAGLFVRAFTGGLPWAHLDIAGPAYLDSGSDQYSAGASGVGAEILFHATQELCK
ncbi:MAG: leucyl aminopeptidase [Eubacteriales bacterium]|nr:leucyl aminopeptidase [Eubacteriales bacterium]